MQKTVTAIAYVAVQNPELTKISDIFIYTSKLAMQMKLLNLPKEKTYTGPAMIWKRIAAFFIDVMILNIFVLFPFRSLFQKIIPKEYSFSEALKLLGTSADFSGFLTSLSFTIAVLMIMYFYLLEKKLGQTIGKYIMKIYVVSDNNELKAWHVLVRNTVFIPVFPFILLWILDPLFMFLTKTNQRLTEILSKTKVVEIYKFE